MVAADAAAAADVAAVPMAAAPTVAEAGAAAAADVAAAVDAVAAGRVAGPTTVVPAAGAGLTAGPMLLESAVLPAAFSNPHPGYSRCLPRTLLLLPLLLPFPQSLLPAVPMYSAVQALLRL